MYSKPFDTIEESHYDESSDRTEREAGPAIQAELAAAKATLAKKDHEITQLCEETREATSQAQGAKTEAENQLENSRLRSEVDKMRALEELREEHRKELVREKDQDLVDFERKRAEEWMLDLKASFKVD